MDPASEIRRIAFVGDYLPRKCGIATFTSDLLAAVAAAHPRSQCFAVSVNDIEGGYEYPEVVRFEIEEQDLSSYLRAADFLNISNVDIVCVQHEFGIFGGPAGSHMLALLRELRMPVVTTLHTVLREPNADQRRVMQELIALSTRLVVMTERGRQMLQEIYQAPPAKIDLIPHGIPDIAVRRSDLFQGPVRRGRQGGAAHVRAALAEQGDRARAQRAAGNSGGVSRRRLHRPGRHASQRAARARRSLPARAWSAWPRRTRSRRTSSSTTASWSWRT